MQAAIYNLINKNRTASLAAYKTLRKLKGFWCIIKEPTTKGSIFGTEDLVEYDEMLAYKKQLLLFGIFQEGEQGLTEFDAFIEAFALTTWEERIPQQSLVEVQFCNRVMSFKVDTHRNVIPSNCSQLFIKNILVPAT